MKNIKSILITSLLATGLLVGGVNAVQVISGDTLTKIAYRANLSLREILDLNPQITNPDLIFPGQEINTGEFNLGAGQPFAPSSFKTTLSRSLSNTMATNTIIYISSLATDDGHTLVSADFGDSVCIPLSINSTGSTKEIAICQGVSATTTAFTDCTRGYKTYADATEASNAKSHSPGESVIITNHQHCPTRQYVNTYSTQIIYGNKTLASTTEPTVKLYFGSNAGAYFWYNTTTDQFGFATSTATERIFNENGTTFTTIPPFTLIGGELKLSTSTYDFILDGTALRLATSSTSRLDDLWDIKYLATSTTPGNWLIGGNATTTGKFVIGNTNPVGGKNGDAYIGGSATITDTFYLGTTKFDFPTTTASTTTITIDGDQVNNFAFTTGFQPKTIKLHFTNFMSETGYNSTMLFTNGDSFRGHYGLYAPAVITTWVGFASTTPILVDDLGAQKHQCVVTITSITATGFSTTFTCTGGTDAINTWMVWEAQNF